MVAQACLQDEEKLLDFKMIFMVNLGHRIPFRLMFFHIFVVIDSLFKLINQDCLKDFAGNFQIKGKSLKVRICNRKGRKGRRQ